MIPVHPTPPITEWDNYAFIPLVMQNGIDFFLSAVFGP